MAVEIERKYLVKGDAWRSDVHLSVEMSQGYLNENGSTIRVRIAGDKAFLTIKGKTSGISRLEFEYEIPVDDAKQLMKLCLTPVVSKVRHCINFGGHVWEVDEFKGDNEGLIVAEVELRSENEQIDLPEWIGMEVSGDKRYRNTRLAKNPFKYWNI